MTFYSGFREKLYRINVFKNLILHPISQYFCHFDELDFLLWNVFSALIKFKIRKRTEHAQHFKLNPRKEHCNAHLNMSMRISDSNKTFKTVHPSAQLTAVGAVEERQRSSLNFRNSPWILKQTMVTRSNFKFLTHDR